MNKNNNYGTGKRTLKDWLKILVLLLDEAIVVVLIIVVLRFAGIQIPLPILIFIGVLLGILVIVMHIKVVPTFRKKPVTGLEEMIGARGIVAEPLTPVGMVMVRGECWRAESICGNIRAGVEVEVVGVERLKLSVKRRD
jgi:membrane-bound ClpP family serine protease